MIDMRKRIPEDFEFASPTFFVGELLDLVTEIVLASYDESVKGGNND